MTQTPATAPVDLYDPLMMMPEQHLVDAICALTNRYVAEALEPHGEEHFNQFRIWALSDLVRELDMPEEFASMLQKAGYDLGSCSLEMCFSLLAGDEDFSND